MEMAMAMVMEVITTMVVITDMAMVITAITMVIKVHQVTTRHHHLHKVTTVVHIMVQANQDLQHQLLQQNKWNFGFKSHISYVT